MTGAWKFSVTPFFLRRNLSIGKKGAPHTTILSFFSTRRATLCTVQFWVWISKIYFGKDKSPEFPFHGTTSSYSYFEVIWIFVQTQQEAKHDHEKLSAEQKLKGCWQSPAMFCLFTHQAKIQICCTVKLIPWNVDSSTRKTLTVQNVVV